METYISVNPHVFRGKTILLPCGNAEVSNFAKYFKNHYEYLGIKELLISDNDYQDEASRALRDKSDIIITNPPFSLLRDFVRWIEPEKRLFSVIVPLSYLSRKYILAYLMTNRVRVSINHPHCFVGQDGCEKQFGNICWITNIPSNSQPPPLQIRTMQDNLDGNQRLKNILVNKFGQSSDYLHYEKYDSYNAIDVPLVSAIPSDYDGIMGVPISFLCKHNRDQFEIIGKFDSTKIDNINLAIPRIRDNVQFARIAIKRKDISK